MNKSKVRFSKNLTAGLTYPVSQSEIDKLKDSKAVSVIHSKNPSVVVRPDEILAPNFPEDGDIFWAELVDVAWCTYLAKRPTKFDEDWSASWPRLNAACLDPNLPFASNTMRWHFNVLSPLDGAKLVRADFPTLILSKLAEYLLMRGAKIRPLLPKVGFSRFTDGPVLLGHLIGWAIHTVSPSAFAAKWYFGRPRPEEVVHGWATDQIEVPRWVDERLGQLVDRDAVIKDMHAFTTYKEGCPNHPAYPAMHGAAAGAGLFFPVFFDLDEELEDEVRRTVANIALFRDFAGVHYKSDSLAGLALGEQVLTKTLPAKLAEYGADLEEVKALCEEKQSDWLIELEQILH